MEIASRRDRPRRPSHLVTLTLTRRELLVLAAAGLIAGCGTGGSGGTSRSATRAPAATPTATAIPPYAAQRITAQNAAHVQQLAILGGSPGNGVPQSGVYSVTWSPDGAVVAGGDAHAEVLVWDAHTGRQRANLSQPMSGVWGVAWSPDSTRLATGAGDFTLRLWGFPA